MKFSGSVYLIRLHKMSGRDLVISSLILTNNSAKCCFFIKNLAAHCALGYKKMDLYFNNLLRSFCEYTVKEYLLKIWLKKAKRFIFNFGRCEATNLTIRHYCWLPWKQFLIFFMNFF